MFTGFIEKKIAVNIGQKEKHFYLQIAHKDQELFTTEKQLYLQIYVELEKKLKSCPQFANFIRILFPKSRR